VQFGDFAWAVGPVGEVSVQLIEEGAAASRKQVAAAGVLDRMTQRHQSRIARAFGEAAQRAGVGPGLDVRILIVAWEEARRGITDDQRERNAETGNIALQRVGLLLGQREAARQDVGQLIERQVEGPGHADHAGFEVGWIFSGEEQHVATEDIQLADHAAGVDHAGIEQPHGGLAVAGKRGAGVESATLNDAVDEPDRWNVASDEGSAGENAARWLAIFPTVGLLPFVRRRR
jgi:hypothetical protein